MDWARDHLGNDVPAWQGGLFAFGLVCPSCGEPVRRRAGIERRPHFAHYSHRAKPECDNYFPSTAHLQSPTHSAALHPAYPRDALNCGLYLDLTRGGDTLKLWLRIPSIDTDLIRTGSIQIQSGLGVHVFPSSALSTARLVHLRPMVPLGTCTGVGDLLPLGSRVSMELAAFVNGVNLFYAGERGGRFVFPEEPLEWGARYRLVSATPQKPPAAVLSALEWQPRPMFAEWHVYELSLPSVFSSSRQDLPSQIGEFLSRKIRTARPQLFVVHPLPHHTEPDGTHVYPAPPEAIFLKRTAPKQVTIRAPNSASCVITELSSEWVRVNHISTGTGDVVLLIDGKEQIVIRTESCSLFSPRGITLHAADVSWDLVSAIPIGEADLTQSVVRVECNSRRLATHIARLNPAALADQSALSFPARSHKEIRGGSFGEVLPRAASSGSEDKKATPAKPLVSKRTASEVWIEGVVAAIHGEAQLLGLRRYINEPTSEGIHYLGGVASSPLMPYIKAARDRKRGS